MVRVKQIFGVIILIMACYYAYLGWSLRSGAFDQGKAADTLAVQLEEAASRKETVLIDCWAWVEAWNSACLSRCPRGERPLVELYLEPGAPAISRETTRESTQNRTRKFYGRGANQPEQIAPRIRGSRARQIHTQHAAIPDLLQLLNLFMDGSILLLPALYGY